jgi:hypothetical protein
MNRKQTLKRLGLALATAAAVGLSGQASADVYAVSKIDITSLSVIFGPSTSPASGGAQAYQFSSQAGATLNGSASTGNSFVTCNGDFNGGTNPTGSCGDGSAGPVLSGEVANAPGGDTDRAEDSFAVITQAGGEFSNAESAIITSTLSSGGVDSTAASGISESNLVTGTTAAAATTTQSTTSLEVVFTIVDDDASVTLFFLADWLQQATITSPDDGQSQSSLSVLTSLTGTAGAASGFLGIWNPDTNPLCSSGSCSASAAGDINETISTDTIGAPQENSGSGAFSVTFDNLQSGTYSLALAIGTGTLVNRVPVPGTLLLMGAGLLFGAGVSRRKKA